MNHSRIGLALAACLLAAGCRDEHSDSAGHEHAGHVIPAHKPKSFPDAVRRLRTLHGQIAPAVSERRVLPGDGTMPIAIDIATWLPEIAADSDMPERPWDRVNNQAAVLLASYEVLGGKRPGDPRAALKAADRALSDLEELLAGADPRWFGKASARSTSPMTEAHR